MGVMTERGREPIY